MGGECWQKQGWTSSLHCVLWCYFWNELTFYLRLIWRNFILHLSAHLFAIAFPQSPFSCWGPLGMQNAADMQFLHGFVMSPCYHLQLKEERSDMIERRTLSRATVGAHEWKQSKSTNNIANKEVQRLVANMANNAWLHWEKTVFACWDSEKTSLGNSTLPISWSPCRQKKEEIRRKWRNNTKKYIPVFFHPPVQFPWWVLKHFMNTSQKGRKTEWSSNHSTSIRTP